ncbi:MAG TPA: protein kinase, partial [Ktedonobacteraceae bacterium]|nr:protein kinase [Ktedonobacteraceae bacterium]
MGEVYLAEDTRIARQVAVKVVRSELDPYPNASVSQDAARLFQREMKAIAALDHPNILPLIDFGEQSINRGMFTYLIMPYRPEGSLVDWLHTRGGSLLS